MPEGHTIHRLARDMAADLVGHRIATDVRQRRFADAAQRLDGTVLDGTSAMGKHLFLHFGAEVLYVHLGLVGKFLRHPNPAPEPSPALRIRLTGPTHSWDLTGAMTCELRAPDVVDEVAAKLGPDPLRPDADARAFVERVQRSRKTIGALLLDQDVIAGIGNVYRAEILHLEGIDPRREGRSLSDDELRGIWQRTVDQLELGLERNRIVTTAAAGEPYEGLPREESFHVYQRETCLRCGAPVASISSGGRSLFACTAEQHLSTGDAARRPA